MVQKSQFAIRYLEFSKFHMKLFTALFKRILPSDDLVMVNNYFQEKETLKDTKGVIRNQHSAAWVHVSSVYTSTFLQIFFAVVLFYETIFHISSGKSRSGAR